VSRRVVRLGLLAGAFIVAGSLGSGCSSKATYTSGGRTAAYWAQVLKQSDVEMRRRAALKIGPLILSDAAAMPATLAALKDEDSAVRLTAIRSLKIYAVSKQSQAVPALREVQTNDKLEQVRDAAAKALEALSENK
jgi:HEAT repeat protein